MASVFKVLLFCVAQETKVDTAIKPNAIEALVISKQDYFK
jgi:hypothetical protein